MINQFKGCILGLALGDALCASHEGGVLERLLWKVLGTTKTGHMRFTDDTQMTIDVAENLINYDAVNQQVLAQAFANNYRWHRGYGPSAGRLLKKIQRGGDWQLLNKAQFKGGSFGNGAAMRVAPIALYFHHDEQQLIKSVEQSAVITHAHQLAISGAQNIALTIAGVLNNYDRQSIIEKLISLNDSVYRKKLQTAQQWLNGDKVITAANIAATLGNGITAIESTVTAIYVAFSHLQKNYDDMIALIQNIKGDTDTIAAMAGAIWGAKNGYDAINHPAINRLESRHALINLAKKLCHQYKKGIKCNFQ